MSRIEYLEAPAWRVVALGLALGWLFQVGCGNSRTPFVRNIQIYRALRRQGSY